MRKSVIDIGTNSSRLLIVEWPEKTLVTRAITTTRIGEGLGKGNLTISEEARKRNLDCLSKYMQIISDYKAESPIIIGTQALREAQNSDEILKEVKNTLGLDITIIPGEKEATLSFQGAVQGKDIDHPMVIDIGGGSTELMIKTNNTVKGKSARLGSLRLLENPMSQEDINSVLKKGWEGLEIPEKGTLIGVGGTATTLCSLILKMKVFDSEKLENVKISLDQVITIINQLESLPLSERLKLPGMMRGREDIMPWGLRLLVEAMKICKVEQLYVTDKDLMYGVLE